MKTKVKVTVMAAVEPVELLLWRNSTGSLFLYGSIRFPYKGTTMQRYHSNSRGNNPFDSPI